MVLGNFFANKNAASILAELDEQTSPRSSDTAVSGEHTYTFTESSPVLDAGKLAATSSVVASELRSNVITKVASGYVESNTRSTVATNETFISYGLKQGHIRVLHRYSEARALLKGHTSPIASLVFLSSHVIASGGQDGKVFVWELREEDENALGVRCVMQGVFSPGCEGLDVYVARGGSKGEMVATVGSSVMLFDVGAMVDGLGGDMVGKEEEVLLDIDPLDPAPHGARLAGFPLQDTPACVSTSKGGVLAVGSARGRVYVAQLDSDGVVGRVTAVDVDGGSCVCGVDWVGRDVMVASVDEGRKKVMYVWDEAALRRVDTLTLTASDGEAPYVHTSGVAVRRLLCLADTRNNAVYVVRVGKGEAVKFESVGLYSVGKPILSMFACWNTEAGKLELTCVQTDGITQYYVDDDEDEVEESEDEVVAQDENGVGEVVEQIVEAMVLEAGGAGEMDEEVKVDQTESKQGSGVPAIEIETEESGVQESQQSESAEDFSLMSALLTPSDIMSTADIKSTGSSKKDVVDVAANRAGDDRGDFPGMNDGEKNEKSGLAKAAKKKKSKKETKEAKETKEVRAPIKVITRDISQRSPIIEGPRVGEPEQQREKGQDAAVDVASVPIDLMGDDVSSSALYLAICRENAKQTKMIEKALNDHRKHVDDQISRALKEMDKQSAANKKAVEASLQTAVKESIRTILPKEVFGAVKTGLDKQLAGAVQQGLSKSVQESFKQSFMKQIVPAFEAACQNMLTQFDGTLQKHLSEVTKEAKEALTSVAAATSAGAVRPTTSGHGQVQSPISVKSVASPKEEIESLVRSGNLEQAFRKALSLQDLGVLGWLCGSIDAPSTLSRSPPPLSQMVLLSLLQQLAVDLSQQTTSKLQWIREAAMNINPRDPAIAHQVKPVLQQVANSLTHNVQKMSPSDASNCKLTIHVVRSQMVG